MNRRQFLITAPSALAGIALYAQRITRRIAHAYESWGKPMQFSGDGLTFPMYFYEHPRTPTATPTATGMPIATPTPTPTLTPTLTPTATPTAIVRKIFMPFIGNGG